MEDLIISENNFEKVRNKIKANSGKPIFFFSDNDELNRKVLEDLNINVLLIKQSGRKDWMKQRNSGFNHVLAKLAKKKNVAIGIDFEEIIKSDKIQEAEILARVKQNIKLCNKNKLTMKFVGVDRNIYDLKALGFVLGMPTWMTRNL